MTGAIIMAVTYGYDAKGNNDQLIAIAREVKDIISEALFPGAHLVNDFPICKFRSIDTEVKNK